MKLYLNESDDLLKKEASKKIDRFIANMKVVDRATAALAIACYESLGFDSWQPLEECSGRGLLDPMATKGNGSVFEGSLVQFIGDGKYIVDVPVTPYESVTVMVSGGPFRFPHSDPVRVWVYARVTGDYKYTSQRGIPKVVPAFHAVWMEGIN